MSNFTGFEPSTYLKKSDRQVPCLISSRHADGWKPVKPCELAQVHQAGPRRPKQELDQSRRVQPRIVIHLGDEMRFRKSSRCVREPSRQQHGTPLTETHE